MENQWRTILLSFTQLQRLEAYTRVTPLFIDEKLKKQRKWKIDSLEPDGDGDTDAKHSTA